VPQTSYPLRGSALERTEGCRLWRFHGGGDHHKYRETITDVVTPDRFDSIADQFIASGGKEEGWRPDSRVRDTVAVRRNVGGPGEGSGESDAPADV